ncbi:MAG TPA: alanine racemase, partial [Holosporales bacterium]|nr:alanine racemase [Holosporales bacterium]
MNETQRDLFDKLRKRFPFALASLANSGGFFLGPKYHYDIVRAGLALTGSYAAIFQIKAPLKPVIKAYAQILQLNEVSAGDSIGYDATFIASRASRIATLGVGYADGYLRSLSNRGEVYFSGTRVPVAGRVSMDLMTIDVTDIPSSKIKAGDWVELFGDNLSIDAVAEKAGTVPWELLTSLGPRYERFYLSNQHEQEVA